MLRTSLDEKVGGLRKLVGQEASIFFASAEKISVSRILRAPFTRLARSYE
jgi:hypothetical protein